MCTSKPKIPTPAPVIERQAYRDPVSRESLAPAGGRDKVRRAMMGVMTSAQGVVGPASTTKRVKMGGDQTLTPDLGTGGGSAAGVKPATTPIIGSPLPVTGIKPSGSKGGGFKFAGGTVGRYARYSAPN